MKERKNQRERKGKERIKIISEKKARRQMWKNKNFCRRDQSKIGLAGLRKKERMNRENRAAKI